MIARLVLALMLLVPLGSEAGISGNPPKAVATAGALETCPAIGIGARRLVLADSLVRRCEADGWVFDANVPLSGTSDDPNDDVACGIVNQLYIDTDGADDDVNDGARAWYCITPGAAGSAVWGGLAASYITAFDASAVATPTGYAPVNTLPGDQLSERLEGMDLGLRSRQVLFFQSNASAVLPTANDETFCIPNTPNLTPTAGYTASRAGYVPANTYRCFVPLAKATYIDRLECTVGFIAAGAGLESGESVSIEVLTDTGTGISGGVPAITVRGALNYDNTTWVEGARRVAHIDQATAGGAMLGVFFNNLVDPDAEFIPDVSCWVYFGTIE